MAQDWKISKEYSINSGILQASTLDLKFFVLYNGNLLDDDVICNIAIYADDTTLYSKRDQSSALP